SPTFRTTLSDAYECLNNAASSVVSSASTTISLTTQPLFSAFTTTAPGHTTSRALNGNTTTTIKSVNTISKTSTTAVVEDDEGGVGSECSICMNNKVNAVIYRCGHMCMCFTCAKEMHHRSGDCPICRTPIIDVI